MKNILTTILFILSMVTVVAQTNERSEEKHLTFKGVAIDGTLKEYISNMQTEGFVLIEQNEGIALFKGDFAGYKNCQIGVVTMDKNDLVSKVGVIFPENDTWKHLSYDYYTLKELLTEKYGAPSLVEEKFNNKYVSEDDNGKMHEIRMNRYKYNAAFQLENGKILLSIENVEESTYVRLMYYDKINGEISREKAMEDL